MTISLTPPPTKDKPWALLGTAALIIVCCGIAPVTLVAGVEAFRDPSSGKAGGGATARVSHHPSPPSAPPQALAPPAAPTPNALPKVSPAAAPPLDQPAEEPLAQAPHHEAPLFEEPPAEQPDVEDPSVEEPSSQATAGEEPSQFPVEQVPLPQVARIGDTVRFGGLEFVVVEMRCGLKQIGTETRGARAVGHFCQLLISVRNIGELAQSPLDTGQTGIGTNGFEYGYDTEASLIANEPDNQNWLSGIEPGGQVSGFVVFDLPEGVDLAQLLLPGGVRVYTK